MLIKLALPKYLSPRSSVFKRLCFDPEWIAEPKKNGKRIIATRAGGETKCGNSIKLPPTITDGIKNGVVVDSELVGGLLWVFDILWFDGDVRFKQLMERKRLLQEAITPGEYLHIVPVIEEDKEKYYPHCLNEGEEGIILKRKDSLYPSGETKYWLKIKPL